ncbi:T6SS phospholipase effector Tle1-like catalytic domain-containing protein [Pseudomonas chlororaphis]|uniref:T6SS phospholipase effector Tle1-like catalytic domain-containing protein n=1 Tax=Pseudomonas chlororaphis TaxID=587753 RepID=UPI0039E1B24D
MSEPMNSGGKMLPSAAMIAPSFPLSRRLPKDPKQLSENIRRQKRDEAVFANQQRKLLQAKGDTHSGVPCCKTLHVSMIFDGTNNNNDADSASTPSSCSNMARLYHASLGSDDITRGEGYFSYYSPGVGTVFPDIREFTPKNMGLVGASGGENRINWGLTRMIAALKDALPGQDPLSLADTQALVDAMATNWYGNVFSAGLLENGEKKREAAMRPYMDDLEKVLKQRQDSEEKPHILAMRLYVYGFSRGAAQARTFANWLQALTRCQGSNGKVEYRFAGLPISIEFLGICDTVAAVGLADSAPFAAGHMDWADGTMRLPDEAVEQCMDTSLPEDCHFLKRCVHLASAHEQRASFPLDSIRRRPKNAGGQRDTSKPSSYRSGTVEYLYPGVHSDVGGGYPPGDQGKAMAGTDHLLSQIPLQHLYAEAFMAGAPLQVPETALEVGVHDEWRAMAPATEIEFNVSDELIKRFNAWQSEAAGQVGPLEDMIKRQQALITAWRIDRYAGGLAQRDFFKNVSADMPQSKIDAWKELEKRHQAEATAAAQGKPAPTYSESEEREHQLNIQIVGKDKYENARWEKAFEPSLDTRQLLGAAAEFRHDYRREWGLVGDGHTSVAVIDMLLGGTVYLINEEDEAEEYAYLHKEGTARYEKMFSAPNKPAAGQEALVALFDDQVHDSRAWFMNSSGVVPREPFTDYFRIRLVHFDNESNKQLSLLATAGRVIGLGIAMASVGLSIKKKDPRMLLGLFLPSLALPVLSGKVGLPDLPEVSAFDPLTGIALPMMSNLDSLRAFTKAPGDLTAKVAALPPLLPLSEATANTPALQKILVAHQALEAVEAARNKDAGSLAGMLAKAANDQDKPGGWKDMLANQVGNLKSSEKKV